MESKYKDRLSEFKDIEAKIIFWSIYDTKHNDILLTYDFIGIKKFEKKKLTHVEGNSYRIYEIADKKTWSNYIAKRIKEPLNKFYCFEKEIFYKEVNYLLDLRHPSILTFIGYSPLYFKDYGKNFWFRYEKCKWTKRLIIIYGITSGISYLHSVYIIHFGLKASIIYFRIWRIWNYFWYFAIEYW